MPLGKQAAGLNRVFLPTPSASPELLCKYVERYIFELTYCDMENINVRITYAYTIGFFNFPMSLHNLKTSSLHLQLKDALSSYRSDSN